MPWEGRSMPVPVNVYEAILAHHGSVAQVMAVQPAIEQAGGSVTVSPPSPKGMVLVTLILPDPYTPQDFLPGLPFYEI